MSTLRAAFQFVSNEHRKNYAFVPRIHNSQLDHKCIDILVIRRPEIIDKKIIFMDILASIEPEHPNQDPFSFPSLFRSDMAPLAWPKSTTLAYEHVYTGVIRTNLITIMRSYNSSNYVRPYLHSIVIDFRSIQ